MYDNFSTRTNINRVAEMVKTWQDKRINAITNPRGALKEADAARKLRDASLKVNKIEAAKDKLESAYKDRLYECEKLVMPLLVNLLKTSDKEYIYWPDRKEQVEGQIDKLLSFTRDK